MAFLDGPFSMQPQRRQPGLFNQPANPTAASSPPGSNDQPAGGSAPIGGAPQMQNYIPINRGNLAVPMTGAPAGPGAAPGAPGAPGAAPVPYSYGGPSMTMLNDAQARTDAMPPAPPAGNGFLDRFNGMFRRRPMFMDGAGGNGFRPFPGMIQE